MWKVPMRFDERRNLPRGANYPGMQYTPSEGLSVFLDYKINCNEPITAWTLAARNADPQGNLKVAIHVWRPIGNGNLNLISKNDIKVYHTGGAVCQKYKFSSSTEKYVD